MAFKGLKIVPSLYAIRTIDRLVSMGLEAVEDETCSDDLTIRTFRFIATALPEVRQALAGTVAMDAAQLAYQVVMSLYTKVKEAKDKVGAKKKAEHQDAAFGADKEIELGAVDGEAVEIEVG